MSAGEILKVSFIKYEILVTIGEMCGLLSASRHRPVKLSVYAQYARLETTSCYSWNPPYELKSTVVSSTWTTTKWNQLRSNFCYVKMLAEEKSELIDRWHKHGPAECQLNIITFVRMKILIITFWYVVNPFCHFLSKDVSGSSFLNSITFFVIAYLWYLDWISNKTGIFSSAGWIRLD